jgi:hypothetical protein
MHIIQYRDDCIDAIKSLGSQAQTKSIAKRVMEARRRRNEDDVDTPEETVQSCLQRHSSDSDCFRGDTELDLFFCAMMKGEGWWSLRQPNVEHYLARRHAKLISKNDEVLFEANKLTIQKLSEAYRKKGERFFGLAWYEQERKVSETIEKHPQLLEAAKKIVASMDAIRV